MDERDAVLIQGYLGGDAASMATVAEWTARAAASFRHRLGEQWEDVLQESQLEVFRLLRERKFRGESSLRTYVWRVVMHECLRRLRAQQRWRLEPVDFDLEAGSEPSPQESTLERESSRILARLLRRLPGSCLVLWRMILDGLSYQEMSSRLGVAEGALRVRVLRCRRRAIRVRGDLERTASGRKVTPAPSGVL